MPTIALLLLLATLLPLASFVTLVFAGRRMGTLAGVLGTLAIGASFALAMSAMLMWLGGSADGAAVVWGAGKAPVLLSYQWVPVGALGAISTGWLDVGIYIDSLTIAMFAMVTTVAPLVHVFSIGYMAGDKRFPRFFTYLGLFCFSMLGLLLSSTILQLFIFWELVGLCSYLLIGFWYERKSASNAAIKAFVTNRIGDLGFLVGFGILFYHMGNVTLPDLWAALGSAGTLTSGALTLGDGSTFAYGLLTVMGIGLFFGAIGKSAQFPLHVWLPDAMEGPTPVSALIHAATMVAAGVYLVGRIFPILTPDAKLFVAIIGCTTLTMAALIAIVQSDIKKVLAYSTLSQLGYMILAMGIGSWIGGLFHLITHAFFKALLFLGAGSVIAAAHHEQELPQYGGLIRKIPVTAITFLIGVLAIAGTPFLSGYFSKDMILTHAAASSLLAGEGGRSAMYWLLFICPTAIAYVTAFYMMRCWMLTFWGKPRNPQVFEHAHEQPVMYIPLIILAALSILAGYNSIMGARELLTYAQRETDVIVRERGGSDVSAFATAWPAESPEAALAADLRKADPDTDHAAALARAQRDWSTAQEIHNHGEHLMHTWVGWAFAIGMGLAIAIYWNGYKVAARIVAFPPLNYIHAWLYRKMYFDELYQAVFINGTRGLAIACNAFDRGVIDRLVNGVAATTRLASTLAGLWDKYVLDGAVHLSGALASGIGMVVRRPQTGRIRAYVTMLFAAVAIGLTVIVFVVLIRG
jgi:NADH-quinone oxidoreductase subunit L